jgi:hypothetical protein
MFEQTGDQSLESGVSIAYRFGSKPAEKGLQRQHNENEPFGRATMIQNSSRAYRNPEPTERNSHVLLLLKRNNLTD